MSAPSLIITSDSLSARISTRGAELQSLTDPAGRELLWDGDGAFWQGRAPILFPIVGALEGGQYRLDGTAYPMAKHGFARHATFDIVAQGPDAATFRLQATDETRAIYPFDFVLDIDFSLSGASLSIIATIANAGASAMPASFGFHPAFCWPLPYGRPRADHAIRFAQAEPGPIRRIDGNGVLIPQAQPTPVDGDRLILRDDLFVDDALIFDRPISRRVTYGADTGPRLEIDFDDLPMLGIWTKPGAGFICIEPWQGVADPAGFAGDIRDKPGIIEIAPGAHKQLAMHIRLAE